MIGVWCAAGGRRFSEGTSADREIQRTLMEVSAHTSATFPIVTVKCDSCELLHCDLAWQNVFRVNV